MRKIHSIVIATITITYLANPAYGREDDPALFQDCKGRWVGAVCDYTGVVNGVGQKVLGRCVEVKPASPLGALQCDHESL